MGGLHVGQADVPQDLCSSAGGTANLKVPNQNLRNKNELPSDLSPTVSSLAGADVSFGVYRS